MRSELVHFSLSPCDCRPDTRLPSNPKISRSCEGLWNPHERNYKYLMQHCDNRTSQSRQTRLEWKSSPASQRHLNIDDIPTFDGTPTDLRMAIPKENLASPKSKMMHERAACHLTDEFQILTSLTDRCHNTVILNLECLNLKFQTKFLSLLILA